MKHNSEHLRDAIKMLICSVGFFVIFYIFFDNGAIDSRGEDTNAKDDPFEFWLIVSLFFTASVVSFIYSLNLFIKCFEEESGTDEK